MKVWRLTKVIHTALDGEGAKRYGGRWNSKGNSMLYTSSSLSLALIEQLVHIDSDEIPNDFVRMEIEIPNIFKIEKINLSDFPSDWKKMADPSWFKERGDIWLDKQITLALMVPSIIVPEEMNILLNPMHPGIKKLETLSIEPFTFDNRLF